MLAGDGVTVTTGRSTGTGPDGGSGDALAVTGPPPVSDAASGARVRDLLAHTALRDGVRLDGPVLLVDDVIRTRWTVTVAAALLVEAGATAVLPLAVHQLP